jgi:hypothetical protein
VLLIQIAGGIVLVVLIVAFLLRGRVSSRRRVRVETRPTLPPSPYQPSRGFHIITGEEPEKPHEVQLPRLDPVKEFVFNDPLATSPEPVHPPHLRHDERWALDRSMKRVPHPRIRRRRRLVWVVVVVVLVAAVVVAIVIGHSPSHHGALVWF